MIRSADSAEKEQATRRLRTPLIVMGHGQPIRIKPPLENNRQATLSHPHRLETSHQPRARP